MNKSIVFFTDLRTKPGLNLLDKLRVLIHKLDFKKMEWKNRFVAVKIHFGEPGNLAYIRPNYAALVVEEIAKLGGKPFLTDANTLYLGQRANAVDHLQAAMRNGFNPMTLNCQVLIADGLKGTDYREILLDLKHCKTAKIGSVIADADIIFSLNHFKGHELTGFGGALKNLGMGSAARGGKLEMHSTSQPRVSPKKCVGCGICVRNCSQSALSLNASKKAQIDYNRCIGCGQCIAMCQYGAMQVVWNSQADVAGEKIAEYAFAVVKDKPHFHVNFIMNVSPNCDCWSNNDMAVIPDIGIAASGDPVALDMACVDLVNQATLNSGSVLDRSDFDMQKDKFCQIHPQTNWRASIDHAATIGLGNPEYELIRI